MGFVIPAMIVALFAGCAESALPRAPAPERMQPDTANQGEETAVTIHGRDFFLDVQASYVDRSRSRLGSQFAARLGDVELEEVTYRDFRALTAVVPASLEPGSYDLEVEDPEGRSGLLRAAFTVLPPERLVVIEDAPGGDGGEVRDVELRLGQTLVLFSVGRSMEGSFIEDLQVSWSVSGDIGSVEPAFSERTIFTATAVGTGSISAAHEQYYDDETGTISVTRCDEDTECADPCRSESACVDGRCIPGEVDKDSDGDGLIYITCPGGEDCDDDNPNCTTDCTDADGDTYCSAHECDDDPDGCGADCFPGNTSPDICDGYDQDCDSKIDEDPDITWYADDDGDGYGDATRSVQACSPPERHVSDNTDCADAAGSDPACNGLDGAQCNPGLSGSDECDGADNDCDGSTDEDHTPTATTCGVGACAGTSGQMICSDGSEQDTCDPLQGAAADDTSCDGIDDDCDGSTDEEYTPTPTTCGLGPCAGTSGQMICSSGSPQDTCDPLQGAAANDASCNDIDDDCDGSTDEEYAPTPTTCGVGACAGNSGQMICSSGSPQDSCDPMQGAAADDTSCDGIDDDCDGNTDEDFSPATSYCGVGACAGNTGQITCSDGSPQDSCDAMQGAAADDPSCDGIDDDCDGSTDEEYTPTPTTCGLGACAGNTGQLICSNGSEQDTCDPLQGASTEGPDGDPSCADSIDNDCDGFTDEYDPGCGSGCMVVTTATDENDGGETAVPPHQGSGLSFREAIGLANNSPGADCIVFDGAMTIQSANNLPSLTDDAGLFIDGGGAVAIDGALNSEIEQIGLDIVSSNNTVTGLEVGNFSTGTSSNGIKIDGTDNQVSGSRIHFCNGHAVMLGGDNNTIGPDNDVEESYGDHGNGVYCTGNGNVIYGNHIHYNSVNGIFLKLGSVNTEIYLNYIHENGGAGISLSQSGTSATIWHNTFYGNSDGIAAAAAVSGLVVENNIFAGHAGYGIEGADASFATLDHCDFFGNGAGACSACSIGASSIIDDPQFNDAAAEDLSLIFGSPAIDTGVDTGLDVNGAAAGNYNGDGPDMGAYEAP